MWHINHNNSEPEVDFPTFFLTTLIKFPWVVLREASWPIRASIKPFIQKVGKGIKKIRKAIKKKRVMLTKKK